MRPLVKTKNERNYTSFNFTKQQKPDPNIRYVRKVKKEVYTNITEMRSLIHAQNKSSAPKPDK
jgi:hypothetical protein